MRNSVRQLLLAGSPSFDPFSIFRDGEYEGFWYEPSVGLNTTYGAANLKAVYQDYDDLDFAVIAGGNSVAMLVDVSQGCSFGPDLIVNGDFATGDLTGWTATAGHVSPTVVGEQMRTASSAGSASSAYQEATVAVNNMVRFRVDQTVDTYTSGAAPRISIWEGGGFSVNIQQSTSTSSKEHDFFARASSTSMRTQLYAGTPSQVIRWDDCTAQVLQSAIAIQETAARMPVYVASRQPFDYAVPYTSAVAAPTGVVCTGLCVDAGNSALAWVCDDGREDEEDTTYEQQVVQFTIATGVSTGTAYDLEALFGSAAGTAQGVADDGTFLWICFPAEATAGDPGVLHKVNKSTGADTGVDYEIAGCNGVAWNSATSRLLVLTSASVLVIDPSDGSTDATYTLPGSLKTSPDHITYLASRNKALITDGLNGVPGRMYMLDLTTGLFDVVISTFVNAEAIEGIAAIGTSGSEQLLIAHDGGFHTNASVKSNQIQTYTPDWTALLTGGPPCLHFLGPDQSDDSYMNSYVAPDGTAGTIFWAGVVPEAEDLQMLCGAFESTGPKRCYLQVATNGRLQVSIGTTSGADVTTTSVYRTFMAIVMTYDSGTCKVWLNGVLEYEDTYSGDIPTGAVMGVGAVLNQQDPPSVSFPSREYLSTYGYLSGRAVTDAEAAGLTEYAGRWAA